MSSRNLIVISDIIEENRIKVVATRNLFIAIIFLSILIVFNYILIINRTGSSYTRILFPYTYILLLLLILIILFSIVISKTNDFISKIDDYLQRQQKNLLDSLFDDQDEFKKWILGVSIFSFLITFVSIFFLIPRRWIQENRIDDSMNKVILGFLIGFYLCLLLAAMASGGTLSRIL